MRRAAQDRSRTRRTWSLHLRSHGVQARCVCEHQPGRFRKGQKVGGCGKPRCWLCHEDKLGQIPTPQDLRERARMRDGLMEYILS
jgi:hypothetical protein